MIATNMNRLYEIAAAQAGYFTTAQAKKAGFSRQVVEYHARSGRFIKSLRGIYRLSHFAEHAHHDLISLWLWSMNRGVYRGRTALYVLGLCDELPRPYSMTVPIAWKKHRFRIPEALSLSYEELSPRYLTREKVPLLVTCWEKTIADCLVAGVPNDIVQEALARNKEKSAKQEDLTPNPSPSAEDGEGKMSPASSLTNDINKILGEIGLDFRLPIYR